MNYLEILKTLIMFSLFSIALHIIFYMFFAGNPYSTFGKSNATLEKTSTSSTLTITGLTSLAWIYLAFVEKIEMSTKITAICFIIICIFFGILISQSKTFKSDNPRST
ncbi:MAG: hypothetical protein L3J07_01905 [Candidatus Magasanikbacteria bacterium]|nr:hypothetical protein [Candidatus Magasanikbacteria bacterium]